MPTSEPAPKHAPKPPTIADLFRSRPKQWGLRGDPFLWDEMSHDPRTKVWPRSARELEEVLAELYRLHVGQRLDQIDNSPAFVERFAHGGMSSGHVSPEFWRDEGIPRLVGRYLQKVDMLEMMRK